MEDRPGGRKSRIKTMLLRREQSRLTAVYGRRRAQRAKEILWKRASPNRVTQSFVAANTRYTLAGTFLLLNGMQSGTNVGQRLGRRVQLDSLEICSVFDATTGSFTRTIVFVDKQANAAAPTAALLLESTTDPTSSPINFDQRNRFEVIADYLVAVDSDAANPGVIRDVLSLCGIDTIFNGSNFGDIRDISTGALYVFRQSGGSVAFDSSTYSCVYKDY